MPSWRDVRKAAAAGLSRVVAATDVAVRRLDLQRQLASERIAQDRTFAAIGRAVAARVKDGEDPPAGTQTLFAELQRIEGRIAELEEELRRLPPVVGGTAADLCPRCGAVVDSRQRFCSSCGLDLEQYRS